MKRNIFRIAAAGLMLVLMVCAHGTAYAQTGGFSENFYLISETRSEIAPGITDRCLVINTADGERQNILYICEADPAVESVDIMTGYPDYDVSDLTKQDTVTNQAADAERATGKDVVVAVNNNFFAEGDGRVEDTFIMNGEVLERGTRFFGMTYDRKLVMGDEEDDVSGLKEAVGGRFILVHNGKPVLKRGDGKLKEHIFASRNVVGITKDDKMIYLVTQGMGNDRSKGLDLYDLAEIMVALGCREAILPDGGGSSTYAVQRPGSDHLTVENRPSYGMERKVSTTLLITSSAQEGFRSSLTVCESKGHTYIKNGSRVKCSVCGKTVKIAAFSGLLTDKASGRKMYYIAGKFRTGWNAAGQDVYYFNKSGLSEKVSVKTQKAMNCTNNGYTVYTCSKAAAADGKTYRMAAALGAPGHLYNETRICERCGWKEVSINECTVKLQQTSYAYTGKAVKPKVTLTANGVKMNSYYDYKITGYKNNIKCGTGKIYISTNFYNGGDLINGSGSIALQEKAYVVTFRIVPAVVKNLKVSRINKTSMRVKWGKRECTGYQIRYSTAKNFKSYKQVNVKGKTSTKKDIRKLKKGKRYYVKVRAYTTVNGAKIFGKWSGTKSVKAVY